MKNIVLAYYELFAILDDGITELFKKLLNSKIATISIAFVFTIQFLLVIIVAWFVKAARKQMESDIKMLNLKN